MELKGMAASWFWGDVHPFSELNWWKDMSCKSRWDYSVLFNLTWLKQIGKNSVTCKYRQVEKLHYMILNSLPISLEGKQKFWTTWPLPDFPSEDSTTWGQIDWKFIEIVNKPSDDVTNRNCKRVIKINLLEDYQSDQRQIAVVITHHKPALS